MATVVILKHTDERYKDMRILFAFDEDGNPIGDHFPIVHIDRLKEEVLRGNDDS